MKRSNLLIAGGLIGIIIVLLSIGIVISSNSANVDNSTVISNSTNDFADENLVFDNSTPEATAMSIARLNEGVIGFCHGSEGMVVNASLTSDGKYWIVNMHEDGFDDWVVTVDAKTWKSKKNGGRERPINTWKSFDELKATYITNIQSGMSSRKPYKITIDGKEIWKVPISSGNEIFGYAYVDTATGKSKAVFFDDGTEGWKTLKEVYNKLDEMGYRGPTLFRDDF